MPVQTKSRAITRKEVRGLFAKSFITQSRDVVWPEVCETIDTFSKTEYFATLGTVPQVEEVYDDSELDATDMVEFTYDFDNKLFKALIRLQRSLVDFDQTGQSRTLLHSLAARVANYPDLLAMTRLRNGDAGTCITGSYFFATDHALGGSAPATQSNLLTGNTATNLFTGVSTLRPGIAEKLQTDLDRAVVQLLGWRDDNNQPFYQKIRPEDLTIVCGPLIFTSMKLALGAKFINQTDNIFEGYVGQIVCSNYLPITGAEAADWYLMYTGHVNRPLIYSRFRLRTDAELQDNLGDMESTGSPFNITMEDLRNLSSIEVLTNLASRGGTNADAHVILNEEFLLAARFRGNVTYGIPWTAVKMNNAAS